MMNVRSLIAAGLLAAISLGSPLQANAHAGHDNRLKLSFAGDALVLNVSVDADLLLDFDANRNGILEAAEFKRNEERIRDWIDHRIRLTSTDGRVLPPFFADMPITGYSQLKDDQPVEQLRIIRRYRVEPGQPLRLAYELFQSGQNEVDYLLYQQYGAVEKGRLSQGTGRMLKLVAPAG